MKERPILMSAPMVRAILDGTKTQTRRAVKPQPNHRARRVVEPFSDGRRWYVANDPNEDGTVIPMDALKPCPYGQPGDRLWVRETWQAFFDDEVPADRPRGPRHTMGIPARPDRKSFVFYKADGPGPVHPDGYAAQWCPSIHMPRKYSRITLEITDVRVERLQEISEVDAAEEGAPPTLAPLDSVRLGAVGTAKEGFRQIWESINGAGSWDANPWVWVIEFRRLAE